MKKHLLFLTLMVFTLPLFSQINYWAWDGTGTGYGKAEYLTSFTATDTMGNVYVTGVFSSPAIQFGNVTLHAADTGGANNIFIVKYDGAGNVVWARSAGGNLDANCKAIAVDAAGDLYLGGWFFGDSLVFDNTVLRQKHLYVTLMTSDNFLAKYDGNGNLLWAKTQDTTSIGLLYVNGIASDAAGNLFVGGSVDAQSGPVIFEGDTLAASSVGPFDILVAKFGPNGNPLLAKNIGYSNSNASDEVYGINTDASGNIYITGIFTGTLNLDTVVLSGTTSNFFAARINSDWSTAWAVTSATPVEADGWNIATDNNGSLYVAGTYSADSFSIGSTTLHGASSLGYGNMFVAKYDTAGNFKWLNAAGTAGDYGPASFAFDSLGVVVLCGSFDDSLFIAGTDTFKNAGGADIFLEAFNPSGGLGWAETYGGSGTEMASVGNSRHGNIYMAGQFGSDTLLVNNYLFLNSDTPDYHSFLLSQGYLPFTGISPVARAERINIYPNPTAGLVNFEIENLQGQSTVQIYNLMDERVYQNAIANGKNEIDLTGASKGVYFYRIAGGNGENVASGSLVVQ